MAFASSSNCRLADSPRKYYHQVQRLHEMTLQRLARYSRIRSTSDTGFSSPALSDADAQRRPTKVASRTPLLSSRSALRRFRTDAYEISDFELTTSINTRDYGPVSSVYLTTTSFEPSETDLWGKTCKPRAKSKDVRYENRKRGQSAAPDYLSGFKPAVATMKRNQSQEPKQMKNTELSYTRRSLSQNSTPSHTIPQAPSNDNPRRSKTQREGLTFANRTSNNKIRSGQLLSKYFGLADVAGPWSRTDRLARRSISSDPKTVQAVGTSRDTLNNRLDLDPASASSLPKRDKSRAIIPYGSKSHSYTPMKKCPSSIYEARRLEALEMSEFRERWAEFGNQLCLHCYGVFPDGKCRPHWHSRRKRDQTPKPPKTNQGISIGKESQAKLKANSETLTPNKTTLEGCSKVSAEGELRTEIPSTENKGSGISSKKNARSVSDRHAEKFIVHFEDQRKTCNIITRKEGLLAESPTLIRLMTVEVDVMIQPLKPIKSLSVTSSSYADSYASSSDEESDHGDDMSSVSGLSCFDYMSSIMNNEDNFEEAEDYRQEPTLDNNENQATIKTVKGDGNVAVQTSFGRQRQFCEISVSDLSISLEKIKSKTKDVYSTQKLFRNKISWSDEGKRLGCSTILKNRLVTDACFSPREANVLLTLHGEPEDDPDNFQGMLICVWSTDNPSNPRSILSAAARINCICFSPLTAGMAFACMGDGSVGLWDLEEPDSMHRMVPVKKEKFVLRYPTYSTPCGDESKGHSSPAWNIIAAYPSSSRRAHTKRRPLMPAASTLFQIATVEEAGVIIFWQVVMVVANESDAKGQPKFRGPPRGFSYHLVMNLKIRLIQEFPLSPEPASHGTLFLKINHQDPDGKAAIANSRFFQRRPHYIPVSEPQILTGPTLGTSSMVQSVDFSPYDPQFFLVGYADGRVFFCHTGRKDPILCIPAYMREEKPVMKVQWSPSRPTVFFVLHGDSAVNIYDLCESTLHPVRTLHITDGPILTMALSPDFSGPYTNHHPTILLAGADGLIVLRELGKVATELRATGEAQYLQILAMNK